MWAGLSIPSLKGPKTWYIYKDWRLKEIFIWISLRIQRISEEFINQIVNFNQVLSNKTHKHMENGILQHNDELYKKNKSRMTCNQTQQPRT
jgi:hypothetical protein